jgi:carboxymethylenebutenolidase
MYEREVVITTQHGTMPSFAVCPDGPGPWPAIVFYMDARGIREELRNMARRIAKAGYFCILPDLYYRLGLIRFDLQKRDETMITMIRAASRSFTRDWVVSDTAAMIAYLDGQDKVAPGPMGSVGYCIGGPFVTWAAAAFPTRMKAAAGICGVRMVTDTPDSPHLFLPKVTGGLYYGFAGKDHFSPPELIRDLRGALDAAKVSYDLDVFEETDHGFCFPERPGFDPAATDAHWNRLFALWERYLKP